jgi:hypothetical protein
VHGPCQSRPARYPAKNQEFSVGGLCVRRHFFTVGRGRPDTPRRIRSFRPARHYPAAFFYHPAADPERGEPCAAGSPEQPAGLTSCEPLCDPPLGVRFPSPACFGHEASSLASLPFNRRAGALGGQPVKKCRRAGSPRPPKTLYLSQTSGHPRPIGKKMPPGRVAVSSENS